MDKGDADVVYAIRQDIDTVVRYAKTSPDEEVADAANRLIGVQEQGLLQLNALLVEDQEFFNSSFW